VKSIREPSLVLSTRAYRDADQILTLLGKNTGKYTAIAKNSRGSRKRFFGGIDLFDCGTFDRKLSSRDPHFSFLQSVSERTVFPRLREKLEVFAFASLCLEITDRFTALEDPEGGALFRPLVLSLRAMGEDDNKSRSLALATYYSLLTLQISGYHLLDNPLVLQEDTKAWFQQMVRDKTPIIPHKPEVAREGFLTVLAYLEETLGERLRTSEQLRKRTASTD